MAEDEKTNIPEENYFLTGDFDHPNEVNMKCTNCNCSTIHTWTKITPSPINSNEMTMEEMLRLTRRLIMCQTCGTLSLKK